ncbi:ribonuclease Z [Sulfoacidibacillus ferrooxidans]|nr:ribonuclease Z [Sulfoacidibacillus ferrooxidans]
MLFLGTGAGAPTPKRNVSCTALTFDQGSEIWLFDCGEGTQQQLARARHSVAHVNHIFITHLHGDHILGLPGLLGSRSMQARVTEPLMIFGPPGLRSFLTCVLDATQTTLGFPLTIHEIEQDGVILENAHMTVEARQLVHGVKSFGYALLEHERPGRFHRDLAQSAGIPEGPLYGQLKRGYDIRLPDGQIMLSKEFVDPPIRGRKIVILGDTISCAASLQLAQCADVLVHEATFSDEQRQLAQISMHSTAAQAAELAVHAHVSTLIMTHISARYEAQSTDHPLLQEARAIFEHTYLAEDFSVFSIPRTGLVAEDAR